MNAVVSLPSWLQQKEETVNSALPQWLVNVRQQLREALLISGLPSRQDERWKYTDLSFLGARQFVAAKQEVGEVAELVKKHKLDHSARILLVFVNGVFAPAYSDITKLPAGVIAMNMKTAVKQHGELMRAHWPALIDAVAFPFAAVNVVNFEDGLFLAVPEQVEISAPIHLLSIATDESEFIAYPHHMILLGKNSRATLVEEYVSTALKPHMWNVMTTIHADTEAHFEQVKLQADNSQAIHMANTFVQQKQRSETAFMNFSLGSLFARDDVTVLLQELGAQCRTGGFYYLQTKDQYVDNHIDIRHTAPRTQSEMLFKGIVDNKARAVFNGRLYVEKDAQKILAYQANHNLLLSNEAEVYSKPELEIYADDVKCKHGATTGQVDQEAMFYLRSRGIGEREAMHLLLSGFLEEVIQRISDAAIRQYVQARIQL